MKNLFKNQSEVASQTEALEKGITQKENDLKNYDILKVIITVFIAETAIPQYRERKVSRYVDAMQNFCQEELANAQRSHQTWETFNTKISMLNKNNW